ncbi:MAG: MATE family efflux transporter [Bacteroidales bacterium]|nr:MATE family efflux transporter [Bacteroidales bacterium]
MKSSITNSSIWNIAYPIIFGNLAQTIITFTDTAFLGHLGRVELGASMMAGLYYFVFSTLAWGFSMGVQIIIARRLGEGKLQRIGVVFEHGLFFVLLLSILMFSLLHFFTADLLNYLIDSPNIYQAAMQYMDYRHYGIIFVCFNFLFRSLYVGLSYTKCITYSTILMASVNIFLDWCLIFGNCGFPEIGVSGAALASVCAEISALIFFIIYTFKKLPLHVYALFQFHKLEGWLMKTILKLAFPSMLQRLISFGSWFLFFALIEKMGELPIAVSGIVRSIYMLIMIPVFAFSATGNTIVSRMIGAKKQNEVMPTLMKVIINCLIGVVPMAVITICIPDVVAQIYTDDIALATASVPVLYIVCGSAIFSSFSFVYFEAVSGTGNTMPALLIESGVLILYIVFIYCMTTIFKVDIQWVWTSEFVYAFLIGSFSFLYLKHSKWQQKKI